MYDCQKLGKIGLKTISALAVSGLVLAGSFGSAEAGWVRLAYEGEKVKFTGRIYVAYGAGDRWVYGWVDGKAHLDGGGFHCGNDWKGDPYHGVRKVCFHWVQ
jgi:hypothetical protein